MPRRMPGFFAAMHTTKTSGGRFWYFGAAYFGYSAGRKNQGLSA